MDVRNKQYKNQGIHVITALFTIEQGIIKVLLIYLLFFLKKLYISPYYDN